TAYRNAVTAAKAAAEALEIEESPLLSELHGRKDEIPDGADKDLKKAFINKMRQIEKAAQDLKAKAIPSAKPQRKSVEQALNEANEAAKAAAQAAETATKAAKAAAQAAAAAAKPPKSD